MEYVCKLNVNTYLVKWRTALVKVNFGVFDVVGHDIVNSYVRTPLVLYATLPEADNQ